MRSFLPQRTVTLQEWRCRPKIGRAQLVEWAGQDPSLIFHHHIPADAIPQTFHISQKLRKYQLTFEYGHSHHIMLFENDRIANEQQIPMEYVFTSIEARDAFQGDILGTTLIEGFDMDVVWSDNVHEKNNMGNVEGLAILERLHIWRDKQWPHRHTISFLASKSSGMLEEYPVSGFKHAERSHGTVMIKQRTEREHRSSNAGSSSGRRGSSILRRLSGMGTISDEAVDASLASPIRESPGETDHRCPKWLNIRFTGKSKCTCSKHCPPVLTISRYRSQALLSGLQQCSRTRWAARRYTISSCARIGRYASSGRTLSLSKAC